MSRDASETALINLSNADRAAKAQPHEDIDSPVATCPANQSKVFVVPVRYALAEHATSHPSCQPGVQPNSHSMAARRLRTGFIYLWQGTGPLQRYGVCAEGKLEPEALDDDDTRIQCGSLTGIALNKHQPAWLMYAEYPLDMQRCEELTHPAARQKRMRQLDLPQVANQLQATHCPPLKAAEQVIAELMPETYHWGVVSDHQLNGESERQQASLLREDMIDNPTPETIQAYTDAMYWVGERDYVISKHADAARDRPAPGYWSAYRWHALRTRRWLQEAQQEAQGLWAVLACLDDDLGVLRDIDHEQDHLEISHQQWIGENQIRLTVGGFVRSLLTEDGAEVANLVNYRFAEHEATVTAEQGETLLDISRKLEPVRYRKAMIMKAGRMNTPAEGKRKLSEADEEIRQIRSPMDTIVPVKVDRDELDSEVRRYRQQKNHNNKNGILDGKIGEYVDLPRMNTWLDETAPDHYRQVEERHTLLYADRGIFLPRHDSGTWFVNYDDADHRAWLDDLAESCLTAQCLYSKGAEQYANYVRSKDKGALRQLFFSWSPNLEAALNSETRLGEILAALSDENMANTKVLLSKALGTAARSVLAHMQAMASNGRWTGMVNRLSPAVLLLKGKADRLSEAWMGLMTFTRINSQIGFRWVQKQNFRTLEAFGQNIDEVQRWATSTGEAIGKGRVADILNSREVQNSGGLTPLIVLMLNLWNASRYWSQAGVVEEMDKQRLHDTFSATLYTAAALAAVVDSRIRKRAGITTLNTKLGTAPIMTLFGSIIGIFSATAAFNEYNSLKTQIEQAQGAVDPWLKFRKNIVGAQTAVYASQALIGLFYTYAAVTGLMSVGAAIIGFGTAMIPIIYLTMLLGGLYIVSWILQRTPLQNFLSNCCWSKPQTKKPEPINTKAQQNEINRLLILLYTPQINYEKIVDYVLTDSMDGIKRQTYIGALSIDLPGATPENINLQVALTGDPVDYDSWMNIRNKNGFAKPSHTMRDIGGYWLKDIRCQWIPHEQGQGLRMSGPFKLTPQTFASLPRKLYLRVKYSTPLTKMLEVDRYIGGEDGLIFAISTGDDVIPLRNAGTPVLNQARLYNVRVQDGSMASYPKEKA